MSLDESAEDRYRSEPAHDLTPDKLYDRRWAMEVITGSLRRLRDEYVTAGHGNLHQAIECTLTGFGGKPLVEIGRTLGLSEGAVKVASFRLRKRFGILLREMILDTVSAPGDVDAELRFLKAIIEDGSTTINLPSAAL